MNWFVYMIKGTDGHFYTGVTTDMERRLKQHNGMILGGARATRKFRPYTLVYLEHFSSRSEVQKRECALKALTHEKKSLLAKGMKKTELRKILSS